MMADQRLLVASTSTTGGKGSPWGGDVGAAVVITLAVGLATALVAGWAGWDVLRSAQWSGVLLVGSVVTAVVVVGRLRPASGGRDAMSGLVLALPSAGIAVVGVIGLVRGAPNGLAWFLNGDHPRHAVYVADTWVQGNLAYTVETYPHGWHSLLAAAWTVVGAGLDPEAVLALLDLMALASLLVSAGVTLSMAHLGHDLARRLGLGSRAATTAAVAVGSATLLNVFLANYQALGYENSLLAALVVAVCVREVLVRPGTTLSLVVCAAGVVVMAHAWQLLLPVVAVSALWCAWEVLTTSSGRVALTTLSLAAVAIGLGAPGVLAVVQEVGLGHASEAGPESPVPLGLLLLGLGSAVALAARAREAVLVAAAAATVVPSFIALALAVGLDVPVLHYYPSKLLWQSALLGLPWIACAAALLIVTLVTTRRFRLLALRAATVGVGVFTAYALLLPWGSQAGSWSTVDGPRVLDAIRTPRASEAVVVWLGANPTSDSVARSLLDVMRVDRTRSRAPQARTSVAQECSLLQEADRPIVLSTEPVDSVRERYDCLAGVEVLEVAGNR